MVEDCLMPETFARKIRAIMPSDASKVGRAKRSVKYPAKPTATVAPLMMPLMDIMQPTSMPIFLPNAFLAYSYSPPDLGYAALSSAEENTVRSAVIEARINESHNIL